MILINRHELNNVIWMYLNSKRFISTIRFLFVIVTRLKILKSKNLF